MTAVAHTHQENAEPKIPAVREDNTIPGTMPPVKRHQCYRARDTFRAALRLWRSYFTKGTDEATICAALAQITTRATVAAR